MSDKRVMVIGSGGRECAFAWKLNKDNEVGQVYCAPGNGCLLYTSPSPRD